MAVPEVLGLTEAFLSQDVSDSSVALSGYSLDHIDLPHSHPVGGIAVSMNKSFLHCKLSRVIPPTSLKYFWLFVTLCNHLRLIYLVYHPLNDDESRMTLFPLPWIIYRIAMHLNSLLLICGNLNCHHASSLGVSCPETCHRIVAKAFCNSSGLIQF